MGRIADDAAARTVKKGPSCHIGGLLDRMSDEDRVDTDALLAQPKDDMPATVIKAILDGFFEGKAPGTESIRNHRRQVCQCSRG